MQKRAYGQPNRANPIKNYINYGSLRSFLHNAQFSQMLQVAEKRARATLPNNGLSLFGPQEGGRDAKLPRPPRGRILEFDLLLHCGQTVDRIETK